MLSMQLPNNAPAFIDTPTDHFDRPLDDSDIASMEPNLAARIRATLQAAADKAYEIGKANGKEEGEDATAKAMRCDAISSKVWSRSSSTSSARTRTPRSTPSDRWP